MGPWKRQEKRQAWKHNDSDSVGLSPPSPSYGSELTPRTLLSNLSNNVNWQASLEMSIQFPDSPSDRLEKTNLGLPLCFSLCII